MRKRRMWLIGGVGIVVVGFLAWAWMDGGREPVRQISEPVPVPELAQ